VCVCMYAYVHARMCVREALIREISQTRRRRDTYFTSLLLSFNLYICKYIYVYVHIYVRRYIFSCVYVMYIELRLEAKPFWERNL
jgi:hypothetical protein